MNWTLSERFDYEGYHRQPAHCWLNMALFGCGQVPQRSAVVILTEMQDSGTSVTNRIEHIASKVWQRILRPWEIPVSPGRVLWFEHYPERSRSFPESYDLVTFDWNDRMEASRAVWHRVDEKFIEQLTRFPLNLSHL